MAITTAFTVTDDDGAEVLVQIIELDGEKLISLSQDEDVIWLGKGALEELARAITKVGEV
jgi:hypothetical protein